MKHERRRLPQSQKIKRFARIKKIVAAFLSASIVLFLAVFFSFVPFRLLLPAYKIPPRGAGELRLHFLGLGEGVSIVEFPDGEALVLNAGDSSFDSENMLCRYLRGLDFTSLGVAATHTSADHIGGMHALFEVFSVNKVYLPAASDTKAYHNFLSAVKKEGCEEERLVRYGTIENKSGAYAVCLSPYSEESEDKTADDTSTVLFLSYAGVRAVLGGDISKSRENMLASEYAIYPEIFDSGNFKVRLEEIDILLGTKRASDSGDKEDWLALLKPKETILCCNQKKPPAAYALARAVKYSKTVRRTDELGAVMVTIKDGEYRVQTHVIG